MPSAEHEVMTTGASSQVSRKQSVWAWFDKVLPTATDNQLWAGLGFVVRWCALIGGAVYCYISIQHTLDTPFAQLTIRMVVEFLVYVAASALILRTIFSKRKPDYEAWGGFAFLGACAFYIGYGLWHKFVR